jgi:drug/metabolite transporter (DMT)-like permease
MMTTPQSASQTAPWRILVALAAVYLIWGSTYLGIRFAIESVPPFLMAGMRNALAGGLLFVWARVRGTAAPRHVHWRSALIIGAFMLVGGNGGVTWAEQHVPSGLAALMIGATPLWIVVLNWLAFGGTRPNRRMTLGLGVGLVGLALLVGPTQLIGDDQVDPVGSAVLLLAALLWATGSLYSRQARLPDSPMQATGMEMLSGGVLLLLLGTATGEWGDFHPGSISRRSAVAMVYLVLFGSLIGFTAYAWLLHHTTPARAASYAYVNPIVAVILGWALAGEALTLRMILAAAVIIGSVVLITSLRAQQGMRFPERDAEPTPLVEAARSEAGAGK